MRRAIDGPDPETRLARHFERFAQLPWPSQMMRFDAETYLPEDVLTKVDRMSMAHSIESRVPLLDNEVIAFASSLPASLKIKNGRRKHVLKEVAAALLPREILDRRKQGFGVPLGTWFRGNLRELFADTLLSPTSLQRGYFQPRFVRQHRRRAPVRHRRDHTLRLWQLVVFERWHRQYADIEPAPAAARGLLSEVVMLKRVVISTLQPLVAHRVYTVRHGLARGLRRRGGLGFVPQVGARRRRSSSSRSFRSTARRCSMSAATKGSSPSSSRGASARAGRS